jgi:serine protease AprX
MAQYHGAIIVAGIGNGLEACDPPLYPGASANVIGVGVIDSVNSDKAENYLAHFALPHREHSSFGPTGDGRCKPDIVSPGNCLVADANSPARYQTTGSWSSFSTPIVAGTLALLVQKAKEEPNLAPAISPEGGNCVMKATPPLHTGS